MDVTLQKSSIRSMMMRESGNEKSDSIEMEEWTVLSGGDAEQPTISEGGEFHQKKTTKTTTNDVHQQQQQQDENVLNLMDSVDAYLTLMDSLSFTLRQGWLELASARYSMGASRINTALLDLKCHNASTSLQLTAHHPHTPDSNSGEQPHFTLSKWSFSPSHDPPVEPENPEDEVTNKLDGLRLRHMETPPTSELDGESSLGKESPHSPVEYQVQKERHKSLAVFGTLVSPKLRAAQLSFETALEVLIDIANTRSSMLVAFQKVQQDLAGNVNR